MDWVRSLVRDPQLAPSWTWNAYQKEVVTGGERERVYDEPMDSDDAYRYEVCRSTSLTLLRSYPNPIGSTQR